MRPRRRRGQASVTASWVTARRERVARSREARGCLAWHAPARLDGTLARGRLRHVPAASCQGPDQGRVQRDDHQRPDGVERDEHEVGDHTQRRQHDRGRIAPAATLQNDHSGSGDEDPEQQDQPTPSGDVERVGVSGWGGVQTVADHGREPGQELPQTEHEHDGDGKDRVTVQPGVFASPAAPR